MEKTFHVIIEEERRTDDRKDRTAKHDGQIHDMGQRVGYYRDTPDGKEFVEDYNDPNIAYAASWNGIDPYIELHKGKVADLNLAFMGWPMITREEWESQPPPAP